MSKRGRESFREWVDRHPDPELDLLPLTHITKGLIAEDIVRAGAITPDSVDKLGGPFAYFFYGRPAYRCGSGPVIKMEAACPYCFIFDKSLIRRATDIYAFDTGAYNARMYKHVLMDEMSVSDFSLERDITRPNRLIEAVFGGANLYFDGDRTSLLDPDVGAKAWEFEGKAYLQLLSSPGRNEPDDRIGSIEVVFRDPIPLEGGLLAIVVPHTLWREEDRTPWLTGLHKDGVRIVPYKFVPGRSPEHYHTLIELAVRELYEDWKVL